MGRPIFDTFFITKIFSLIYNSQINLVTLIKSAFTVSSRDMYSEIFNTQLSKAGE